MSRITYEYHNEIIIQPYNNNQPQRMTVRRVRRTPGGGGASPGGITSTNKRNANKNKNHQPSPSSSSSRPERSGAIMARGDTTTTNTNTDSDDCWSAGESTAASYSKHATRKNKPGISLSEKLRQQELVLGQEQQRHEANNQRVGRGPVMDTDHTALEQQQQGRGNPKKSTAGEQQHEVSIDGSAWSSWGSNSRGNSTRGSKGSTNGMKRMPIGASTGGRAGGKFTALFNRAASRYKMNLVGDATAHHNGGSSKLKERMMSVVNNCTKKQQDPSPQRHTHQQQEQHQQQQQQRGYSTQHGDSNSSGGMIMKIVAFLLFVLFGRAVVHLGKHRGIIGTATSSSSSYYSKKRSSSSSSRINDQYSSNNLRGIVPNNADDTSNSNNIIIHQATFPTHLSHLSNLTRTYNPKIETPYFWDVHFSGESVAEYIFGHCHDLIQASEFGMRQPGYNQDVSERV